VNEDYCFCERRFLPLGLFFSFAARHCVRTSLSLSGSYCDQRCMIFFLRSENGKVCFRFLSHMIFDATYDICISIGIGSRRRVLSSKSSTVLISRFLI